MINTGKCPPPPLPPPPPPPLQLPSQGADARFCLGITVQGELGKVLICGSVSLLHFNLYKLRAHELWHLNIYLSTSGERWQVYLFNIVKLVLIDNCKTSTPQWTPPTLEAHFVCDT